MAILEHFRAPDCSFVFPFLPAELDDQDELDISHEALIRQWPRLCDPGVDRNSVPKGCVHREFHDGLIWRSLAVQAEGYAANAKNLLSAATTEQRLPWFRKVELRPGWTSRHALADRRGDPAAVDRQWHNVSAMMKASAKNLERERMLTRRLRRSRNASVGLLVLAILSALLNGILYIDARGARQETKRQYVTWVDRVVVPLLRQSCSRYHRPGSQQLERCAESLRREYSRSLEFTTGRALSAQPTFGTGQAVAPGPPSAAPNDGRR